MKKTVILVVLFALAGGFIYSDPTADQIRQAANTLGVPFDDLRQFVQSYQTKDAPSGAIQIEARRLVEDYRGNQLKADTQYKGKTLQITGKVNQVKKNYSDQYYIEIEGIGMSTIDVYVQSSELSKIGNLNSGQTITIAGKCKGYETYSVDITDAYFVR
jgi:hypothetical protein